MRGRIRPQFVRAESDASLSLEQRDCLHTRGRTATVEHIEALEPQSQQSSQHPADLQQSSSPVEAEARAAQGASVVLPRGLLRWERDNWTHCQEQGAHLRAQLIEVISSGDAEAESNLREALRRLGRVQQVLQERITELWLLEGRLPSAPAQLSQLPLASATALRDRQPSPEHQHLDSAVEANPPLHSPAREGVRTLPGQDAVQMHELLDQSEPLGVRQASHDVHTTGPHLGSVRDFLESALEADGPSHNAISGGVRSRPEQLTTTSAGVRSHSGRGKVPRDLPHFRGNAKNAIQDALEFMDRFETVCEPNGIEDEQLMRVLPICLDQVDGAWFKMWRDGNAQADWQAAKRAFLGHFRHPNELTVLQAQIQALKMDSAGVQRYADQFRKLMAQLGWTDKMPMAIFQFKQGLTRPMLDKLSGAEANIELIASFTGNLDITVGVDALISMALRIEADRALNISWRDSQDGHSSWQDGALARWSSSRSSEMWLL